MQTSPRVFTSLCALLFAATTAQAQFYKIHNGDIGGGALGQFTTPLTSNYTGVTQSTRDSFGGYFTIRDHPVSWAGIEVNYGYTRFSEIYNASTYSANPKTNMHEATAAYLFHPHFRKLQPFVSVGGGYIDFVPVTSGQNQWRGTGLLEVGFDLPTSNPHFGFRVQGRDLIYRAPNFQQANLGSKTWVNTEEPTFGVWLRY